MVLRLGGSARLTQRPLRESSGPESRVVAERQREVCVLRGKACLGKDLSFVLVFVFHISHSSQRTGGGALARGQVGALSPR